MRVRLAETGSSSTVLVLAGCGFDADGMESVVVGPGDVKCVYKRGAKEATRVVGGSGAGARARH